MDEFEFPTPPASASPTERIAWEIYWAKMLALGFGTGFLDLFSCALDGEATQIATLSGCRRVLCLGNGLSFEPHGLAAAGLEVDVLEISPYANHVAENAQPHPHQPNAFCPPALRRPGGSARFVRGDALDPSICPGPYDMIIERRLLQLVPESDQARALDAIARRLSPTGFLFSQAHNGGWRPDEPLEHPLAATFRLAGWAEAPLIPTTACKGDGKTVMVFLTTG